jgi:cyclopropane fatty-acyl-phospholipid synthase-like methyltransferase
MNSTELLQRVRDYYSRKVEEHGPTASGVDWNSAESQSCRFQQLLGLLPGDSRPVSLLDWGCGYGALVAELASRRDSFEYLGYDLSEQMVACARQLHGADARCRFTTEEPGEPVDYVVSSGIFNVCHDTPRPVWTEYIQETLSSMDALARRGFAFNILTSYSDPEYRREHLYYADPCHWFDWCKTRFSRQVALLHDYGLYEFTMLVRKDL